MLNFVSNEKYINMKVQIKFNDQEILLGEDFNTNEAKELMLEIIDKTINYRKVQQLRSWEKDHSFDSTTINDQIKLLRLQREELIMGNYKMNGHAQNIDLNSDERAASS